MMRLICPFCGARDEPEFEFGAESHIKRPPLEATDAEWAAYLYFRSNPKGIHHERWRHGYGCGQWFNVVRNTVTHELLATYLIADPPP
jgi:sarcosine oxidase subunit delta